ncbi:STAS domain-containing protein [Craterilacuibacter sp.]|uniref:STAS domain-containing protein n=1 Tax=Craterilacuibacter sp. TaxID=2870909 RepID=UPI003F37034F
MAARTVQPAELTMLTVAHALKRLSAELNSHDSLHLDLSALTRADSAALALLFELARQAKVKGKCFTLYGMPEPLLSLARLYGAEALLDNLLEHAA